MTAPISPGWRLNLAQFLHQVGESGRKLKVRDCPGFSNSLLLHTERKRPMEGQNPIDVQFRPETAERLPDLTEFSQCHGKFRYCSCMRWRMTSSAFRRSSKQDRVDALEELVRAGTPVGILAYHEEQPVAWCSIAPRETCAALER